MGTGTLYRCHYDWKNRRWLDYGTSLGDDWNTYKQLASPGADIIYALDGGYGVHWSRWDVANKKFATSGKRNTREYLMWWENVQEFTVDIDACKLVSPVTVTPPATTAPQNERGPRSREAPSPSCGVAGAAVCPASCPA